MVVRIGAGKRSIEIGDHQQTLIGECDVDIRNRTAEICAVHPAEHAGHDDHIELIPIQRGRQRLGDGSLREIHIGKQSPSRLDRLRGRLDDESLPLGMATKEAGSEISGCSPDVEQRPAGTHSNCLQSLKDAVIPGSLRRL